MRITRFLSPVLFGALCACGSANVAAELGLDVAETDALTSTCSATWSASTAYSAGNTASIAGNNYKANWWTQGDSPQTQSGPTGSGKPWTLVGACGAATTPTTPVPTDGGTSANTGASKGACAQIWTGAAVYTAGMTASLNNVDYKANWWTKGENPSQNGGPSGSGKVWTNLGACSGTGTGSTSTPPSSGTSPSTPPALPSPTSSSKFVFSAYKDVSISANWNTSVISTAVTGSLTPLLQLATQTPAITWSFATGECGSENWGGIAAQTLASANVANWVSAKKPYIISTGGAAGAFTCGSDASFASFLDRYISPYMLGVDFDIEAGQSAAQIDALVARVKAAQANSKYKTLRFSFTIATLGGSAPQSLGSAGIQVMSSIKSAGLKNYYINLMAMDYGSDSAQTCTLAKNGSCAMGLSAAQAAINLHQTYAVPYSQIELTPMIGGNDTQGETFSLADADVVSAFAKQNGLGGVHFWSLDRDHDCPPGYASPICNSYGQAGVLGFTQKFAKGLQ